MTRALPLLLLALSLPAAATAASRSPAATWPMPMPSASTANDSGPAGGWPTRPSSTAMAAIPGSPMPKAARSVPRWRATATDLDLSYAFPRYRGRPAVLLQISAAHLRSNTGNSETLAAIGPHEAFHRYAQEDWPGLRKPGGYRGDLATLDPRPREYRYALFQSLLQALRTPGQRDSYLSDAQGWLRRWREAAPEESRLAAQVDLSEGTARYIEMAAAALPHRFRRGSATLSAGAAGVRAGLLRCQRDRRRRRQRSLRDRRAGRSAAGPARRRRGLEGSRDSRHLAAGLPAARPASGLERTSRRRAGARRALPARDGRHPPAPGRVAGGLRRPTATAAGDPTTAPHHRLHHGGQQGARGFYVLADGPFRQAYLGARWNVGELTLDGVDYLEGDAEAYCPGYGRSALIPLRGGAWREARWRRKNPACAAAWRLLAASSTGGPFIAQRRMLRGPTTALQCPLAAATPPRARHEVPADRADPLLPVRNQPADRSPLPLLPQLLALHPGSHPRTWRAARRLPRRAPAAALPPLAPGRLRPGSGAPGTGVRLPQNGEARR